MNIIKRAFNKTKRTFNKLPQPLKTENYKNVLHIWNIGACGSIMVKNLKQHGYTGETIMRKSHDPFNVTELYGDQSLNMEGGEFLDHAKRIAPKFGIIHTHGIYENIPELRKLFPNKILIVHYHGSDIVDCKNNKFRLKCVTDADAVLCSTPDLMEYAKNDPVPAYYIPNAVDQDIFKPMPEIHKESDRALLQTMRYIDLPRLEKYLNDNCPWQYEVYDRESKQVPLFEMAKVYNKYKKLIDCKIYKYTKDDKPVQAISKTGLEALACGLEVFNYEGKIIKGLPNEHTIEHQAKILIPIYEKLVANRYNPTEYWSNRGKTYLTNFNYNSDFINQERIVMNKLSTLQFNSVIEFGCGFGRFTKLISEKYKLINFEAFDLSIDQVNNAKKICDVDIKQSTIQTFEPNNKAELVFGSEVLMHVLPSDIEECIERIVSWSSKYIIIIDVTTTDTPMSAHNFIHDYNTLLKKYGHITEIKIGLQSMFVLRKNN